MTEETNTEAGEPTPGIVERLARDDVERKRFLKMAGKRMGGAVSISGSSTSTFFCSEWMSPSRRSPGDRRPSPISRNATTGFLSLSRGTAICAPAAIVRAR